MREWLLLAYRIPREPSASRVHVWRKMKLLGALMLQDAVWVLPATPKTGERFQWLATEITELGGEATLWESSLVYATDGEALKRRFEEQVDEVYSEILQSALAASADLAEVSRRFQRANEIDFLHSSLGWKVRDALLKAGRPTRGRRRGVKS